MKPLGVLSECTGSKGLVTRFTIVRINLCLCFACTHTSHCSLLCGTRMPLTRDRNAAECRWASLLCHIITSDIVALGFVASGIVASGIVASGIVAAGIVASGIVTSGIVASVVRCS